MKQRVRWGEVLLALSFLGIVGAIVLQPTFPSWRSAPASMCLSNAKNAAIGLLIYAADENDRFPPRDLWMDATFPYVKTESFWHCPSVPKGAYGYAFNGALSRAKQTLLDNPATTPMVYDSVNPIRNASDLCVSLPLPGRHRQKDGQGPGRNMVGYADGHAKAVPGTPAR